MSINLPAAIMLALATFSRLTAPTATTLTLTEAAMPAGARVPGQTFEVTFIYSWSNANAGSHDLTLSTTLPSSLEYVGSAGGVSVTGPNATGFMLVGLQSFTAASDAFTSTNLSGTGSLTLSLRFKPGVATNTQGCFTPQAAMMPHGNGASEAQASHLLCFTAGASSAVPSSISLSTTTSTSLTAPPAPGQDFIVTANFLWAGASAGTHNLAFLAHLPPSLEFVSITPAMAAPSLAGVISSGTSFTAVASSPSTAGSATWLLKVHFKPGTAANTVACIDLGLSEGSTVAGPAPRCVTSGAPVSVAKTIALLLVTSTTATGPQAPGKIFDVAVNYQWTGASPGQHALTFTFVLPSQLEYVSSTIPAPPPNLSGFMNYTTGFIAVANAANVLGGGTWTLKVRFKAGIAVGTQACVAFGVTEGSIAAAPAQRCVIAGS